MKDQLEFLDLINIMSFIIGVMNYDENLTQGDKQDLMSEFDTKAKKVLDEIHAHLTEQDKKINQLLERTR